MIPLRSTDMRQQNERIVLNRFYDDEYISQSYIVQKTGLKASTVMRIFANLEQAGEIMLVEPEEHDLPKSEKVGRHPVYYQLNPSAHYSLGLSFSKSTIAFLAVDFSLNTHYSVSRPFNIPDTADELCDAIARFVLNCIEDAKIPMRTILGLGIACPGNVDSARCILCRVSARPNICNYPLAEKLGLKLPFPILLEGANLLASQYLDRYETDPVYTRSLFFSIGSELTGSFYEATDTGMLDGLSRLPLGSLLIERPNAIINMSHVPNLNDICSEKAILAKINTLAGISTMEELDEKLEKGDPLLQKYIQDLGETISYWISNLCMLFLPKSLIIASRSKRFSQALAKAASDYLNENYYWPFENEPAIRGTRFSHRKTCRAAVDLVFDKEFSVNLGWERPNLLNQNDQVTGWNLHVNTNTE